MPKVILANDNVRESVTRPTVLDIARQLLEYTGLEQMPVLFPGDDEVAAQPGSTIDNEGAFNRTANNPLMRISIKDEHRAEMLLATAVHQQEHQDIFYDESLGVALRPVYSPSVLTFEFEIRSTDVNAAKRWRDEVRTRISSGRDVRTHVINYHYMIPAEYIPLLQHIHELREAQAGYGEDFETYLDKYFTANVTKVATLVGGQERYAVVEQAGQIMGQFEFAELPDDPQKQGDTSAYKQMFSYRIYFESPVATTADYPVLVHNQLIDQKYLQFQPKPDRQTFASRSPRSVAALRVFEVDCLAKPTVKSGLRLPEFHEFIPRSAPSHTLQVLSALVGIESKEANPDNRKIMNFSEIDEQWEFRKEFIDHLKYDHMWLHKYGESLVNVTVYDEHMPLHHSLFQVDKDLNVVLNFEPDLRRTYYVRLSLLTRPGLLSKPAKDRARENADGLILIGVTLVPSLVKDKKLPVVKDGNYVPRDEGKKFFDEIDKVTGGHQGGTLADHAVVQWNTVMILYIETDHKSQLGK